MFIISSRGNFLFSKTKHMSFPKIHILSVVMSLNQYIVPSSARCPELAQFHNPLTPTRLTMPLVLARAHEFAFFRTSVRPGGSRGFPEPRRRDIGRWFSEASGLGAK